MQPMRNTAEKSEHIARLLLAVTDEVALLSREIMELGEIVCADPMAGERRGRPRRLQPFELLAQMSSGHARLLRLLADALRDAAPNNDARISDTIEKIPFQQMRERLRRAL